MMAAGAVLLSGCESDNGRDAADGHRIPLEVMAVSQSFFDIEPWSTREGGTAVAGTTRGTWQEELPAGYMPYNVLFPTTTPEHTTIGVFLTPERTDAVGNFVYIGTDSHGTPTNDWLSTISIKEGQTYYLYGFMPRQGAETATITSPNGSGGDDFKNGAVMQVNNFNTLTAADVSVIVGVRAAASNEDISAPASPVELGKFEYQAQEEDHNYVFLLLKHIYASLHLKASIDAEYHKLRTIKITRMELEAIDIPTVCDLTVSIATNTTNSDPVTSIVFDTEGKPTGSPRLQLFPHISIPETELELQETVPESFLSCFAPSKCQEFNIHTTYDVYDRHGNLIRKGCTAVNHISKEKIQGLDHIGAGEIFTVNLVVRPTYLYVLSEPDLDNPSFEIN